MTNTKTTTIPGLTDELIAALRYHTAHDLLYQICCRALEGDAPCRQSIADILGSLPVTGGCAQRWAREQLGLDVEWHHVGFCGPDWQVAQDLYAAARAAQEVR